MALVRLRHGPAIVFAVPIHTLLVTTGLLSSTLPLLGSDDERVKISTAFNHSKVVELREVVSTNPAYTVPDVAKITEHLERNRAVAAYAQHKREPSECNQHLEETNSRFFA